ncbi:MAG: alkaline phosphatase family protein [Verrucomicrobia bacterium]|nr:alkaline phosphatase family protein [Verrucomicrobiota bacterium]
MRATIALLLTSVGLVLGIFALAPVNFAASNHAAALPQLGNPRSPIRHLIVVVGENRSFDNVFGTYMPAGSQTVWNLLSQGIVQNTGEPGTKVAVAAQQQATDSGTYQLSPAQSGPFALLPQPSTTLDALELPPCYLDPLAFCSDIGLDPTTQGLLKAKGSGQPFFFLGQHPVPDCRYPTNLPNAPYWLIGTSSLRQCSDSAAAIANTTYTGNTGDPVHRFYQMWQQSDCSPANITAENPSGCRHDLYTWVAITVGWDFTGPPTTDEDTYQGGVAMGFYNMAQNDFPYFLDLAYNYAISDNYHQPVMGGTGPNSQFMYTGDVYYFTDVNGNPAQPASSLIENPNPENNTNNYYVNDQFGQVDPGSTGVAFTNCSDTTQPGVAPIVSYLHALPYQPFKNGNCDSNHWYQVNNDYPYYTTKGTVISSSDKLEFPAGPAFSIGPQTLPTIGDALSAQNVSWKYYGGGFAEAAGAFKYNQLYCAICNGFQYARSIMTTSLRQNLVDLSQFYTDVANNQLPAVSFIKPDWLLDGHPGTSTPPLFEAFVRKIVNSVKASEAWSDTAILITFDESGGNYDSGYIQPIDFFGDGPRTVLIAVSPFAKQGYVDHTYADHASILKFIEWNWNLGRLSARSRDNLPNPVTLANAPYFPTNSPAVGDLQTMFDFPSTLPGPTPTPTPHRRPTPHRTPTPHHRPTPRIH